MFLLIMKKMLSYSKKTVTTTEEKKEKKEEKETDQSKAQTPVTKKIIPITDLVHNVKTKKHRGINTIDELEKKTGGSPKVPNKEDEQKKNKIINPIKRKILIKATKINNKETLKILIKAMKINNKDPEMIIIEEIIEMITEVKETDHVKVFS